MYAKRFRVRKYQIFLNIQNIRYRQGFSTLKFKSVQEVRFLDLKMIYYSSKFCFSTYIYGAQGFDDRAEENRDLFLVSISYQPF